MRVIILGKTKDDKGTQLEDLTEAILKNMGFKTIRNGQSSGANEIDVLANKKDTLNIETPVLCECKAHNKPINMDDWQKFLGKLYIERKKNSSTVGLMISLSGANGNVMVSYKNDLSDENNRVQLLSNDDLYSLIASIYSISSFADICSTLQQDYNIKVQGVDTAYYNKSLYLLISLGYNRFTICNPNGIPYKREEVSQILPLLKNETEYNENSFKDIWSEKEIQEQSRLIESYIILSVFLNITNDISDIHKRLIREDNKQPIGVERIHTVINESEYLDLDENSTHVNLRQTDSVSLIKHIFELGPADKSLFTAWFTSQKLQELINLELLEQIKEIQFGIDLSEDEKKKCLFMISHSPSALCYVLYPDRMLTNYKITGRLNANMKELFHNHFWEKLIHLFEFDFKNNVDILNELKVLSIKISTNVEVTCGNDIIQTGYQQRLSVATMEGVESPVIINQILD